MTEKDKKAPEMTKEQFMHHVEDVFAPSRPANYNDAHKIFAIEKRATEYTHSPNISYHIKYQPNREVTEALMINPDYNFTVLTGREHYLIGYYAIDFEDKQNKEAVVYDIAINEWNKGHSVAVSKILREIEEKTLSRNFNSISISAHENCEIVKDRVLQKHGYELVEKKKGHNIKDENKYTCFYRKVLKA